MKTLSEKQQNRIIIFLLFVFIAMGLYLYFDGKGGADPEKISLYKKEIQIQDSLELTKISNLLKNQNVEIVKKRNDSVEVSSLLKDNLKISYKKYRELQEAKQIDINLLLEENLKINNKKYKDIQEAKNKEIFKQLKIKSKDNTPFWICIIIVICGILGGYASKFYAYLEDIIPKSENVRESISKINFQIAEGDDPNQMKDELKKLNEQIEELKRKLSEESKTHIASILFGVIASFFSILILKAGESNVLKFESYMDYFVFSCYCLLSALFAKRIIEVIINTVIKDHSNKTKSS